MISNLYLFFILLFVLFVFNYKRNRENFVSSDKFRGEKQGYVFKNDSKGLGYYLDLMSLKN